MAALVIAQGVLLRLVWTLSGAPYAVNVLGATNPTAQAINQALVNTVGAAIKAALSTSGMAAELSTTVSLSTVGLRDINAPNKAEFLHTTGAVAGSNAAAILPPQTALVGTWRTDGAGPSFRGRTYFPGFTEAGNEPGGIASSAVVQAVGEFMGNIFTIMNTNSLPLAVLSRPRDAATIPARTIEAKAGFATPITLLLVRDSTWDTQRRRATAGI